MSDGWTPLFSSVFTGSMRGKPEELLVWFTVLSRKNREGIVDCSLRCLAEDCGLPVEVIQRCIERFCAPDPESRSQTEDGAKLVRLADRGFGWRVVNHSYYRERARKQRYNEEQTASGADAERKRIARQQSKCPDASGDVQTFPAIRSDQIKSETESEEETESDTSPPSVSRNHNKAKDTPPPSRGSPEGETTRKRVSIRAAKRMPADYVPSPSVCEWVAANCPDIEFHVELAALRDYEFRNGHTDWDATLRNWMRRAQSQLKRMFPKGNIPRERESRFDRMQRRLDEI